MTELNALSETELNQKWSEVSLKRKFGALLLVLSIIFAIVVPASAQDTGVQINGIDVSSHNGTINWSSVKSAGVQFAMLRDGYGGDGNASIWDDQTDTQFEANYSGAVQNGIKVGVYHYSYATNATMASQEADECLHILNSRHLDYPVAYDVEDACHNGLSSDTLGQIVQAFCSKIQQAGYKVMVYSNKDFYLNHLTSSLVSQYDSWIAHTGGATSSGVSPCSIWQYSSTASVSGVPTNCDADYSYVDFAGTGSGSNTTVTKMDPLTFKSDTSSYTFGSNSTYVYKITTPDTFPPTAVSSNSSAITVSGPKAISDGYLFTLTNVGVGDAVITTTAGDGRSVSFHATGNGAAEAISTDTTYYQFGSNSAYYYKITTAAASTPTASSSNPSAVSVSFVKKLSDGYLYQISNVGKGSAVITTTTAKGNLVFFTAIGTGALRCDTSSYQFGSRTTYSYRIWSADSSAPKAVSSNSSAVSVSYSKKLSDGYLYSIRKVGRGSAAITTTAKNGASVSFKVS